MPDPCECGCGKVGTLRMKRSRDGRYHVHRCQCRSCKGRRARTNSAARERKVAAAVNGTREVLSGAVSGADVSSPWLVYEETANIGLVAGLRRWWERPVVIRKTAKILAADLPGAFVASWDGRPQLVVMSWESHQRLMQAITVHGGEL